MGPQEEEVQSEGPRSCYAWPTVESFHMVALGTSVEVLVEEQGRCMTGCCDMRRAMVVGHAQAEQHNQERMRSHENSLGVLDQRQTIVELE